MKGKKSDPQFISNFIRDCVGNGIQTTELIVNHAKILIQNIDNEIQEIEKKKIIRSKLLDVVITFEKPNKDKNEEIRLLSFFKLENPQICKWICETIKMGPFVIDKKMNLDTKFAVKQLIEFEVLSKINDHLLRGKRYDEYMHFVLREV